MTSPDPHLTAARDELELLVAAVAGADPAATVPGCDAWTISELAGHVAGVLGMIDLTRDAGSVDAAIRPDRLGPDDDVVEVIRRRGHDALDGLAAMPADTPMWSWADRTVGFWRRRIRFELVMHRLDAERATGARTPLDPGTASEAIDEWFTTYVIGRALWQTLDAGRSVHVHCTDADGEWTLRVGADGHELTREHAKGDVALRGPAEDLLLVLYGREKIGDTGVEVFGDETVAELVLGWTV